MASAGPLRLLAFVEDGAGQVGNLFPTSNRRGGPWQQVYRWDSPCALAAPNAGQPRAYSIRVQAGSAQAAGDGGPLYDSTGGTVEDQGRRRGLPMLPPVTDR